MLMGTVVCKDVPVQVWLSCPKLRDMAKVEDATVMQNASSFGVVANQQTRLFCKQESNEGSTRRLHHLKDAHSKLKAIDS